MLENGIFTEFRFTFLYAKAHKSNIELLKSRKLHVAFKQIIEEMQTHNATTREQFSQHLSRRAHVQDHMAAVGNIGALAAVLQIGYDVLTQTKACFVPFFGA